MHKRYILILSLLIVVNFSCKKLDINVYEIEGIVTDPASRLPVSDIKISIDGIKSSSGWGIITDGKRETIGRTSTDANGYYHIKLKIFKDAERLEFYLNPGLEKADYVERQNTYPLAGINRKETNLVNFTLSPAALIKISYKNAMPVSDSDFFYFGWYNNGTGSTKGIIKQEDCGTIKVSDAFTWRGKDVCGTLTAGTIAEDYTHIYWTVIKNGITNNYNDSIFVKRGAVSEFLLNY